MHAQSNGGWRSVHTSADEDTKLYMQLMNGQNDLQNSFPNL